MAFQEESFSLDWYVELWADFFKRFKKKIQKFDGTWVEAKPQTTFGDYLFEIQLMPADDKVTLTIDYTDIRNAVIHQPDKIAGTHDEYKYTVYDNLAKQVENNANIARNCARKAVLSLLEEDYAKRNEDQVRAEFSGILTEVQIPAINTELDNKFIKTEGVVIYRDDVSTIEHYNRVYQCSIGHLTRSNINRINPPTKCQGFDPISKTLVNCEETMLEENADLAKKEDRFEFLIQERMDRVVDFRSPSMIWIRVLGRDNVNWAMNNIRNADFVSVCGIVKEEETQERQRDKRIKVYEHYIQASSIQKRPHSELVEDNPTLRELVKVAVTPDDEEDDYRKLVNSVAPDIYKAESDVIAETVLLTMVGSDERINPISGSRTRGEIQIALFGDAGTAKSSYLKFACRCIVRSFYNSGDKTSAVSLIGGIKSSQKEGKTGKLEIGAYGLGQLIGIDEMEKMRYEDLQRLSEPMQDDQSISIGKQGYNKHQEISVATIALANPYKEHAKWDITKDIFENTRLPSWLLQRFDAIFILRDVQDDYSDMEKISFKAKSMRTHMKTNEFNKVKDKQSFALKAGKTSEGDLYSIGFMRHWVQYVRDNFHPNIWENEEALAAIQKFYLQFRKYSIRIPTKKEKEEGTWTRDMEIPAIELRGFMSICRFAEARARACHRNFCTVDDAEAAINIVRISKMSAGLNTSSLLSGDKTDLDPELAELKRKSMRDIKYDMLDRQRTGEGRTFTNELEKISWIPCTNTMCRGQGVVYDDETPIVCPECLGNGGFRKTFTINDFRARCSNSARFPIGDKMFREMFSRALKSGEIVLDKHGPVKMFANTKTKAEVALQKMKLEDIEGKYRFLADDVNKDTVEGVHKRRLLERNPTLAKLIERIDKDNPEDNKNDS